MNTVAGLWLVYSSQVESSGTFLALRDLSHILLTDIGSQILH